MNRNKLLSAFLLSTLGDSMGSNIHGMNREEITKKYDFNNIEGFSNIIAHIKNETMSDDIPVIDMQSLPPVFNKDFRFSFNDCKHFHISYYSQLQLYLFESLSQTDTVNVNELLKKIEEAYLVWYETQLEPYSNDDTYLSLQPEMNEARCDNQYLLELMEDKHYFNGREIKIETELHPIKKMIGKLFHKEPDIVETPTEMSLRGEDSLYELVNSMSVGLALATNKQQNAKNAFILAYKMAELTTTNRYSILSAGCMSYIIFQLYTTSDKLEKILKELILFVNNIPKTDYFQSSLRHILKEHVGTNLTFKKDLESIVCKYKTLKNADNVLLLIITLIHNLEEYQIEPVALIETMINGTDAHVCNWDSRVLGIMSGFVYGLVCPVKEKIEQVREVNVYTHVESLVEKLTELEQTKES